MTPAEPLATVPGTSSGFFAPTCWTVILAAQQKENSSASSPALEKLCRTYWQPLHAYARWQGLGDEDARDATQAFFAQILARNSLAEVNQSKGKFRSFLLAAFKHFLSNERDKARAQKRGGGRAHLSLDAQEDETLPAPADPRLTPDQAFDRQWALTLLEHVLGRLRAESAAHGKEAWFESIKPFLTGDQAPGTMAEISRRHGLSESAFKVSLHRLRRRYRALLRDEIAQTVANPAEIDHELQALIQALR